MKMNIIQIVIAFMLLTLFSACGSSDNNGNPPYNNGEKPNISSPNGFTPKTASAFESKFVNKDIHPPSGNIITILPNSRIRQTIKNQTAGEGTYVYESAGSDMVVLKYMIGDVNCIVNLSWTSELRGNAKEEYKTTDFSTNANGTFFINGKN